MIDTKSVREYLLEAAIHGLLWTNNRDDDSSVLLPQIEAEYKSLLEAKQTKAIVDAQMITEGVFSIPIGWNWVPLGKICVLLSRGKSPKYSDVKRYPVFAQKCNQPLALALDRALFLDEATLDKWPTYFRLVNGDVLINSTGTGTMGRVGFFDNSQLNPEYPFMVPDSHVTVARLGKGIVSKYIYYALRSPSLQHVMENQFRGSTNQKEFYIDSVVAIPVPLPPTEVQEQIVNLLDRVNSALDTIDTLQAKYADNLAVLKSKLIDAAIQGKLTEQLPEDGTAEELYRQIQAEKQSLIKAGKIKKEKPLPEIAADEVPFEIPKSWKWVRLPELCTMPITDGTHQTPTYAEKETGIPFLSSKDVTKGKINWSSIKYITKDLHEVLYRRIAPQKNDILLAKNGTTGVAALVENDEIFDIYVTLAVIRPNCKYVNPQFLLYAINSQSCKKQFDKCLIGIGVPNLHLVHIKQTILPLPPLAEQQRIVKRLDEVLKLVEVGQGGAGRAAV